jgi:hypothetical protein
MKRMCDHYKLGDVINVAGVQPHVVRRVTIREVILRALPDGAVQVETEVSPTAGEIKVMDAPSTPPPTKKKAARRRTATN